MVQRSLWPAFEELFDAAEEHALGVLVGRWREMEQEEESKVASGVSSSVLVYSTCTVGALGGCGVVQCSVV